MKMTGMLVVSLRGFKSRILVSLGVFRTKLIFLAVKVSFRVARGELKKRRHSILGSRIERKSR